jgi:tripeptide aminopeptidase
MLCAGGRVQTAVSRIITEFIVVGMDVMMNIVDRFIAYTEINTTTNRENGAAGIMPSSPNQLVLAKKLSAGLD